MLALLQCGHSGNNSLFVMNDRVADCHSCDLSTGFLEEESYPQIWDRLTFLVRRLTWSKA